MVALRRGLLSTFAAGLVVALAFGAGYFVGSQEAAQAQGSPPSTVTPTPDPRESFAQPPDDLTEQFHVFWQVWNLIQQEYLAGPVDQTQLLYGAIRGMLETLDDPYSVFFDPTTHKLQQASLEGIYEGIGTAIDLKDGQLTIITVFEGSPAAGAGLQTGDVLLSVNGREVAGLSMAEVATLIRGPADTSIRLTISRSGLLEAEILEFTVVRRRVTMPSVTTRFAADDLAIIKIRTFAATTPRQFAAALRRVREREVRGIVLDLRNNPGGYLGSSVAVASQFLPADTVVLIEQLGNGEQKLHKTRRDGWMLDMPLVVLVNNGSASGAEIVAGALADHARAILVGETTFGKGTVQVQHDLTDGSAVRITMARWLTPSGHVIQGVGLAPDEVVTQTADDRTEELDPPMVRAQQLLRLPAATPTPVATPTPAAATPTPTTVPLPVNR